MNDVVTWISYWKPKDAWYYAGADERDRHLSRWREIWSAAEAHGAAHVSTASIRANSPWARVSVWQFPSVEALVSMVDELEEAGYSRFLDTDNVVGTPDDDPFGPYLEAAKYTDGVA